MHAVFNYFRRHAHGINSITRFEIRVGAGASLITKVDQMLRRSLVTCACSIVTDRKQYTAAAPQKVHLGILTSKYFILLDSTCRCYTKESAPEKSTGSENHHPRKGSDTKDGSHITKASPINQRAAAAILMQLSSPPNILTLSRILATPYLSNLLISHHTEKLGDTAAMLESTTTDATTTAATDIMTSVSTNIDLSLTPVFALSLFLAMGFTDYLDGFIARKYPSTATVLGTYLDPFADKVFISVMSLTLWYTGTLPGPLVGLWVVRDVGMLCSAYWMVRAETLKRSKNKTGDESASRDAEPIAIMDPTSTPLKVEANFLSKVNTTLQIGLIALGIAGEVPSINIPSELMTSLW